MVHAAYYKDSASHDTAVKGLSQYGIKVIDDRLIISNNCQPLRGVLRDTPWTDYRRMLSNYPMADNHGNKTVYFYPGITTKATSIPIADILDIGVDVGEDEDGWQMEGFE